MRPFDMTEYLVTSLSLLCVRMLMRLYLYMVFKAYTNEA